MSKYAESLRIVDGRYTYIGEGYVRRMYEQAKSKIKDNPKSY